MNEKMVALLERKLADAKAGRLTTVALIGGYENGGLQIETEGEVAPLLIGSVQLTEQMRRAMFPEAGQVPSVSQPMGSRRFSS